MLSQFLRSLTAQPPQAPREANVRTAVAALLAEAARRDDRLDPAERATIERLLAERFQLDPDASRALAQTGEDAADDSLHLFGFTQALVKALDEEERAQVIELMWEVAYADGVLSPDEDALLRRVAGLMHVDDRARGDARKRAMARLGLQG